MVVAPRTLALLVATRFALTLELGIDPGHILQKSLTVLNPLGKVDTHIMDDADMAGPLVFCFAFAFVLLLVSCRYAGKWCERERERVESCEARI